MITKVAFTLTLLCILTYMQVWNDYIADAANIDILNTGFPGTSSAEFGDPGGSADAAGASWHLTSAAARPGAGEP